MTKKNNCLHNTARLSEDGQELLKFSITIQLFFNKEISMVTNFLVIKSLY